MCRFFVSSHRRMTMPALCLAPPSQLAARTGVAQAADRSYSIETASAAAALVKTTT